VCRPGVTDTGVHADVTARARPPALRTCTEDHDETEWRQTNKGAGWTHGRSQLVELLSYTWSCIITSVKSNLTKGRIANLSPFKWICLMQPVATDVALAWSVCMYVCLSVGHTNEPCKNGWTEQNAVWEADVHGPKEPCIRWGSSMGRDNFWEFPVRLKNIKSVCCGVCIKRVHSTITNGVTSDVTFRHNSLTTCFMFYDDSNSPLWRWQ